MLIGDKLLALFVFVSKSIVVILTDVPPHHALTSGSYWKFVAFPSTRVRQLLFQDGLFYYIHDRLLKSPATSL